MTNKRNKEKNFHITVFGGSLPIRGEPAYDDAFELGRLLGTAGYSVLTGGYIGTMEAVSRGAAEAGGHVIGVTCDEIEAWRPVKPNQWVQEERRYPSLRERLSGLIDGCDAAIALPGGVGTLAEIAMLWAQMQVFSIQPRPLILVGNGWQATMEMFFASLGRYVPENTQQSVFFASDISAAFFQLQSSLPVS